MWANHAINSMCCVLIVDNTKQQNHVFGKKIAIFTVILSQDVSLTHFYLRIFKQFFFQYLSFKCVPGILRYIPFCLYF